MSDGDSVGSRFPRRGRIPMGPGGEFDLIRKLLGPEQDLPPGVDVGPGDDCAVLEGGLVISADLSMEGIHFQRDWLTPEEVGYRATAAALSDLAAMAAEPLGALVSLALGSVGPGPSTSPGAGDEAGLTVADSAALAMEVQKGADAACQREGIRILGGDLTRSPGPLVINVVVLGRAGSPVLRTGAQVGDEVWVTGWLGASRGAVRLWERGEIPTGKLRESFALPRPRIREALWLSERVPIRSLIDISDGLAGDAGHLAAAAGNAVVLEETSVPAHPALAAVLDPGEDSALFSLQGGEDFELCFAVPPNTLDEWVDPFQDSFAIPLTRVGEVAEGKGVFLKTGAGESVPVEGMGFDHFSSDGRGTPHEENR